MIEYVVIQTGEFRDEIDEIKVFGPFTCQEAWEFQLKLEEQDTRIGYQRATRVVKLTTEVPSDAEVLGEDGEDG